MTNDERGLVWYGVVPAFFVVLVGMGYLIYQFLAFRISPFFGAKDLDVEKIKSLVLSFGSEHPTLSIVFLVFAVIIVIIYFILPPLCEGGIIGLTSALHKGKENVKPGDGIVIGAHHYLRMFEYRMVVGTFSFVYFLTVVSLTVRKLGVSGWLIGLMIFLFVASLILGFLFVYTQNFIVLEGRRIIPAFMGSAKLVVGNFGQTLLMWMLMLLISLRVVINIFLVFLIPVLVAAVTNFLVTTIALRLGILLASIAGITVLMIAAYLAGVLHVFTTAAWTLTFINLDHHRAEKLLEK